MIETPINEIERYRKRFYNAVIVGPIITVLLSFAFFLFLSLISPGPTSSNPLFLSLYMGTAFSSPMIFIVFIFGRDLFREEKKRGEVCGANYLKYLAAAIAVLLITSLLIVFIYAEYASPLTYYCELNATENSTAWTITVSNLTPDDDLPISLVYYILEDGETGHLLEYGHLNKISDSPSQGYNITFVDNDRNGYFNNGDFFIIQKAGGISGSVKRTDYFHLEFEDQSTPLTKINRLYEF